MMIIKSKETIAFYVVGGEMKQVDFEFNQRFLYCVSERCSIPKVRITNNTGGEVVVSAHDTFERLAETEWSVNTGVILKLDFPYNIFEGKIGHEYTSSNPDTNIELVNRLLKRMFYGEISGKSLHSKIKNAILYKTIYIFPENSGKITIERYD